jgi:hypothetical protein
MQAVTKRWTELGKAKLSSSGLTTAIADTLGMYEVASAALLHESFLPLPAIILPYHNTQGTPASSHPRWPHFYRGRYLAKGNSFKDLATDKSQRYFQPPGSGVCAYFPRMENWEQIVKDTSQGITITEGEFKAAAACDNGFPTIGLGGVWNFMAQREGVVFLPELEKFDWSKRAVWVCFDSDYASKPEICAAINRLTQELDERGAMVNVLLLPDLVEGAKTGLDDYFLQKGPDEFEDLLDNSEPLGFSRALWKLNQDVIYVEDPGLVIVEATRQKLAPSQFKEHSRWATASYPERSITKNGDILVKKEPAAPAWIKWPLRRTAHKITYAPGAPAITDDNYFNQWPGWGVVPKPGDIKPFTQLIDYLFEGLEKESKDWLYDWFAYPLQNPGVKMFSSVVIHGVVQGTGKTLVGLTLGRIYGANYKEIKDDDLESTYWAENKQFIMGDEISGRDNRQYANTLKRLITQQNVTINIKYVPQYDVPDCINYLFTSQHPDAFFIEDTDRRYFVAEVAANVPLKTEFYSAYDKWLWGDGPSYLFDWLLKRKIKNFNPAAPPPLTQAKERMIRTSKGELAAWVQDLKDFPEQMLGYGGMRHTRDLFTAMELVDMYHTKHPNGKANAVGMGRALAQAGFRQVDGGHALRAPDGSMGRYFAARNVAQWRRCKSRRDMEKNLTLLPVSDRKQK